jgi:hypothetical protein
MLMVVVVVDMGVEWWIGKLVLFLLRRLLLYFSTLLSF